MKKIVIATQNTKTGEVKVQERLFTNDMTSLILVLSIAAFSKKVA